MLVWAVLPAILRLRTRPVAGADYWNRSALRRFIGAKVFHAVLIDRDPQSRTADPVAMMDAALAGGDSLIIFPEGTRNTGGAPLLPLKSGLFHLAARRPAIELSQSGWDRRPFTLRRFLGTHRRGLVAAFGLVGERRVIA